MRAAAMPEMPGGWLIYIMVEDVEELSARPAVEQGGKIVVVEPRGLAGGRFCVIEDPVGPRPCIVVSGLKSRGRAPDSRRLNRNGTPAASRRMRSLIAAQRRRSNTCDALIAAIGLVERSVTTAPRLLLRSIGDGPPEVLHHDAASRRRCRAGATSIATSPAPTCSIRCISSRCATRSRRCAGFATKRRTGSARASITGSIVSARTCSTKWISCSTSRSRCDAGARRRAPGTDVHQDGTDRLRDDRADRAGAMRNIWQRWASGQVATADEQRAPTTHGVLRQFRRFDLLTARERRRRSLLLRGHSTKAIARELDIAPGTVMVHKRNLFSKLGITSQYELFSLFIDELSSA